MKNSERYYIKAWKASQMRALTKIYPDMAPDTIEAILDQQIEERCINPKCTLHNNYENTQIKTTLLAVIDWIQDTHPIIAGFGCFFKNQNQQKNPKAKLIQKILADRAAFKAKLKLYDRTDPMYAKYDRFQLTKKNIANSDYGGSGCPTYKGFNLYTAAATTGTGRILISTARACFESFIINNTKFKSLNECIEFLNNVVYDEYKIDVNLVDEQKTIDDVYRKLKDNFEEFKAEYEFPIKRYLQNIPKDMLTRIYYKNNLYEFIQNEKIRDLLLKIFKIVNTKKGIKNPRTSLLIDPKAKDGEAWEFVDANDVPANIKKDIDLYCSYVEDFVVYDKIPIDRVKRLKEDSRKSVTTIDTDSCMTCITVWVNEANKMIDTYDTSIREKNQLMLYFAIINVMAYTLTQVIAKSMLRFTTNSNILDEMKANIVMKNELLLTVQLLSDTKKRYISTQLLREGAILNPPKDDIKGKNHCSCKTPLIVWKIFINIKTISSEAI